MPADVFVEKFKATLLSLVVDCINGARGIGLVHVQHALDNLDDVISKVVKEQRANDFANAREIINEFKIEAYEDAAKIAESDTCLPQCDSTAHENLCPVVYPHRAIRARKNEVCK